MKTLENNVRCQNGRNHKVCLCDPLKGIFNHLRVDEKTVAERKWRAPTKAKAEQKPCDHGLFSDDAKRTDLLDLTRA